MTSTVPRPHRRRGNTGALLVAVLLLLVILSLLGVWGLSSSRSGILRAGHFRGGVKIQYEAEEGLQRAVRRLQEISSPLLADSLGNPEKDLGFIVGSLCEPVGSECADPDPPCPEPFDATKAFDTVTENVICNFLGTSLKNTQVVLVRKADYAGGGSRSAVFLINAISRDQAQRRRVVQGVAIVPYEINYSLIATGGSLADAVVPSSAPYLATIVRVPGS